MVDDWAAVGQAITGRMSDLRRTQQQVASAAQISLTTLRELQHNINPRRRRPQTLQAVSVALDWPADYLGKVLASGQPTKSIAESDAIDALRVEVADLRERVNALERSQQDA